MYIYFPHYIYMYVYILLFVQCVIGVFFRFPHKMRILRVCHSNIPQISQCVIGSAGLTFESVIGIFLRFADVS